MKQTSSEVTFPALMILTVQVALPQWYAVEGAATSAASVFLFRPLPFSDRSLHLSISLKNWSGRSQRNSLETANAWPKQDIRPNHACIRESARSEIGPGHNHHSMSN